MSTDADTDADTEAAVDATADADATADRDAGRDRTSDRTSGRIPGGPAAGSAGPDEPRADQRTATERPATPPGKPRGMPTTVYEDQVARLCDVRSTLAAMDAVEDFEVRLDERATVRGSAALDPAYDFRPLNDLLVEHPSLRIEFLTADERTRTLRTETATEPRRATGWTVRVVFSDADL